MRVRPENGTTTVEFAIVGALFFMVLLGILEFGRAIYTWNTLSEVARRGARIAAVCPLYHSAIERVALITSPGDTGDSPFVRGLGPQHIGIEYLDEDGASIADPAGNFSDIWFVRVSITGFDYTTLIPFISMDRVIRAPGFSATLPRESLGIPREGASPVCFGTAT
ncbi:MAG: pilus assembly protein [Gammaproteobacteria bacterium]|nr:pilus assembly protein [Gammaproteobacteria bacterium]